MSSEIDTKMYSQCLFDINQRIKTIGKYLNHEHQKPEEEDEKLLNVVEFLCLQFRKIIEHIAYLSWIANRNEISKIQAQFAYNRNIEDIFADLERVNPQFYPHPVIKEETDTPKFFRWVDVNEGFMTKEEAIKIYEICGGMLHTINPYNTTTIDLEIYDQFIDWLYKIHKLLSSHIIRLSDGHHTVAALLETTENGWPQTVIFERVD